MILTSTAFFLASVLLTFSPFAMASTAHSGNTFTTPGGTTYAYDYIPAQGNNHTVLFLHGFPSTRHDWQHQFETFSAAGFGVIAPDQLGFGDSDRPTDVTVYRARNLSNDLAALLDSEGIVKVVGVGHDYGSDVLSKLYYYHPDKFEKLAFLAVGYSPVGFRLEVDAINAMTLAQNGYTQFGYWYFMNTYDASEVIEKNLESFYSIIYSPNYTKLWVSSFAQIGGLRSWLESGKVDDLASWTTQAHKDKWLKAFSRPNAAKASTNVYRRIFHGINAADEAGLNPMENTVKVPLLVIGGSQDVVTPGQWAIENSRPFAAAGLEELIVEAGHWVQLERKEEVSDALLKFASK